MIYVLPFSDIATGATGDAFKTIAAIIAANTAGHRAWLQNLCLGFADDSPADANVGIKLRRVQSYAGSGVTAGTFDTSVAAADIPKLDPNSIDCLMTAKLSATVEPDPYIDVGFQIDLNAHGGLDHWWHDFESAPKLGPNELFALLAAPRASAARRLSGHMQFKLY